MMLISGISIVKQSNLISIKQSQNYLNKLHDCDSLVCPTMIHDINHRIMFRFQDCKMMLTSTCTIMHHFIILLIKKENNNGAVRIYGTTNPFFCAGYINSLP